MHVGLPPTPHTLQRYILQLLRWAITLRKTFHMRSQYYQVKFIFQMTKHFLCEKNMRYC